VHGTWSIVLCEHQLTHLITKEIFGWVEIWTQVSQMIHPRSVHNSTSSHSQ
jgi:hypothetical protein